MRKIWVDKDKCVGCRTCELQCAVERQSVSKTLAGAVKENPKPVPRVGVSGWTGSSMALQSRASSHQTVPGTTVVIMVSEASAVGSRSVSGITTKRLWTGRLRLRTRVQNTSRLDSTTS